MKKFLTKMIPLTLLVLALCMSSIAASANTVAISDKTFNGETISMDVEYDATASGQVVVLVVDGNHKTDGYLGTVGTTESLEDFQNKIVYVDQASSAAGATTNFTFLPNDKTAEEHTVTLYASGTSVSEIAVETLELKNAPAVFAVTLNTNGGTIAVGEEVISYTAGTAVTLPRPTKDGHTFLGWTATNEASDVAYIETIAGTEGTDLTFYAKWTPIVIEDSDDLGVAGDATGADAGYYLEDETKKYLISVTAKVDEATIENVAKYGFVILNGTNPAKKMETDASVNSGATALTAAGYYTLAYDIAADKVASTISFKPYVIMNDGSIAYGVAATYSVDDFDGYDSKYLGTAAELELN